MQYDSRALAPTAADRLRQISVTLAEVGCVLGTLVGVGILGTQVNEAGGGRFAADSTLLTPNGPAFSIWSVIYTGLFAYTIWQWHPANTTKPLARKTGYLAVWSMLLNAAWLLVVQQEWFWMSVFVIVLLLACLLALAWTLRGTSAPPVSDKVIVYGTFGLYLGWVSVATLANIAATLAGGSWPCTGIFATLCTLIVLSVVVALVWKYLQWFGPRLSIYAAMAWGVAWIAQGRFQGEPRSTVVGIAAALVAFTIVALSITAWLKKVTAVSTTSQNRKPRVH